jgi:hypothetical protein
MAPPTAQLHRLTVGALEQLVVLKARSGGVVDFSKFVD